VVDGGTFELLGRKDRIVKIEEKRVSLQAIEASLSGSTYVQEARAVVLEGARTEIAAVIVLSAAGTELLQKSSNHAHAEPGVARRGVRKGGAHWTST
jgi:acyl-coenzyme A synthetase/AMP-(fatty) acid ligase